MNHISYQLSLARRDELLQEAVNRRGPRQLSATPAPSSSTPARRDLVKPWLLWLHRFIRPARETGAAVSARSHEEMPTDVVR
jgi:hypothetical protein